MGARNCRVVRYIRGYLHSGGLIDSGVFTEGRVDTVGARYSSGQISLGLDTAGARYSCGLDTDGSRYILGCINSRVI